MIKEVTAYVATSGGLFYDKKDAILKDISSLSSSISSYQGAPVASPHEINRNATALLELLTELVALKELEKEDEDRDKK